jgi:hypothetical protein
MIRNIPLSKLMPSPRNVRRVSDEQADLQLKADIEARGLLQNLVVTPARKPKGRFTVEAGGRRFRALTSLIGEGKLAADHEVGCLVLDGGPAAAQEAGLAENFQRLAMNPARHCPTSRRSSRRSSSPGSAPSSCWTRQGSRGSTRTTMPSRRMSRRRRTRLTGR